MQDQRPAPSPKLSKKPKNVVLDYNGTRILLDTIASYGGVFLNPSRGSSNTKHGVRFSLRTGEQTEIMGDDKVSRDKVLAFLDAHFKPVNFTANRCQVCIHRKDEDNCSSERSCREYTHFRAFERDKNA